MTRLVVDPSVAVKWALEEPLSAAAMSLASARLLAPDILFVECANVLWKRCARGEITSDDASARLAALQAVPIMLFSSATLLSAALELAIRLEHPIYDCLYLSLARVQRVGLVTADRRLLSASRKDPILAALVEPLQ